MSWADVIVRVVSYLIAGVLGGLLGSWLTAFRVGRWMQRIEDRVEANERRLERGDPHVGEVPILAANQKAIITELRDFRAEVRGDRSRWVTHGECNRRHEYARQGDEPGN